jgi:hypothetical protein
MENIKNSLVAAFLCVFVPLCLCVHLGVAQPQQTQYPKPTELPNPYRLVEGWPAIPKSMNGGQWGEVIRVSVDAKGNIWVFHRCFNVVPAGSATCVGRGAANPPILEFDPSGKLLKSFGVGLFAYPHGFTVGPDGNLWVTDVNDQETVLGMSAKNANGVTMGQEALKLSPDGKVLMVLGKQGVAGTGPDAFDRPTGVAVAPNGDIFISDGHAPNKYGTACGEVLQRRPFHQSLGTQGIRARRVRRAPRSLRWRIPRLGVRRGSHKQAGSGVRPERHIHRRMEAVRPAEFGVCW